MRPEASGSRRLAWEGGTAARACAGWSLRGRSCPERRSPCGARGAPVLRAGPGFAEAPKIAALRGGRAGRGRVSSSGEASLDSPGCATESQILWSCSRNPAQKRASESWGGLRGLLSEELFQAAPVLKVRSYSTKMFALLRESGSRASNPRPLPAWCPSEPAGSSARLWRPQPAAWERPESRQAVRAV